MNPTDEPYPVQVGPDYRCFTCGEPAMGGHFWLPCRSPLDAYAQHIFYLALPCGHNPRTVRLGDVLTAVAFVRLPIFEAQILANVSAIEQRLAHLQRVLAQLKHA